MAGTPKARAQPAKRKWAQAQQQTRVQNTDTQMQNNNGAHGQKRRRCERRDTDDQVDRVIDRKLLSKYPKEVVEGAQAPDGTTPRSMIREEIVATKCKGERLKTEFWTPCFFFKRFLSTGA